MSAVIVTTDTPTPGLQIAGVVMPDRDAGPCWRELVMLALEGICPVDARLEEMIDRIERAS